MIKKEREIPLRLKMEEALLRRLPLKHPKRKQINENLAKSRAGFKGEKELDYHLQFLPEKDFYLFQNIHLPSCQIDTLVLCPAFALIIESKNIYGTLYFDPHARRVTRTYDGQIDGFPDPILQVQRQKKKLSEWSESHKLKPFPIETLVAIGYPSTIIDTPRNNYHIFDKVLHAEQIPKKILELQQSLSQTQLTTYQLNKISDLLLKNHNPPQAPDLFQIYQLNPHDLIIGIPCQTCSPKTLVRLHGFWQCPHCHIRSKDAHEQVIHDYLLINGSLTVQEGCELLQLNKLHTVRRFLTAMDLPSIGSTKNKTFLSPWRPYTPNGSGR